MNIIEQQYNWAYGPTLRRGTNLIVLHHAAATSASPEDIHRWHLMQGWRGIAYHFYIRKDGSVYRGREENVQGGHTLNFDATSIGICFEGNFENEGMREQQIDAGAELLAYLRENYGNLPVMRHCDLNATACPGRNFPFSELLDAAEPGPAPVPSDDEWGRSMSAYLNDLAELPGSEWAQEECEWAVRKGLFIGNDARWMSWKSSPTREELAIVLYRFAKLLEGQR